MKIKSISGRIDSYLKNEIITEGTSNNIQDETDIVDSELNKGINRKFKTSFEIINNETDEIRRNSAGYLVLDEDKDYTITAGLITKKYSLTDIKVKTDININKIK